MSASIVVGWTHSAASNAALDWAVDHGLLTGRSVVAVHELGDEPQSEDIASAARVKREMARMCRRYTDDLPDLSLHAVVERGTPAAGLLRWSQSAEILAVGSRGDRHPRLMGALTDHLAATADSPVALIPRQWRRPATSDRRVVLGATTTIAGRAATNFAVLEAQRMAAALVAVIGADPKSVSGQATMAELAAVAVNHPGVTLEVLWERDDPACVLIDMSSQAQLIVLGTHHSSDRWSIRLGPVTETVLGRAVCPVVTVGRRTKAEVPSLAIPGVADGPASAVQRGPGM